MRRRLAFALAMLAAAMLFALGAGALAQAPGAPPADQDNFFFHGPAGSATFDHTPPSGTGGQQQTSSPAADPETPDDDGAARWQGPFQGTIDRNVELRWWWSTTNPGALAFGDTDIDVSFFAVPAAGTARKIGSGHFTVKVGSTPNTPTFNRNVIPVKGTVAAGETLVVKAVATFIDTGPGLTVHYDSTDTPSGFGIPFTNAVQPAVLPGRDGQPAAPADGLAFSAAVPSDPQRDIGEPNIEVDPAGNSYTCGPTGFSNASDYANVSTDGGDQFHLLGQPPRGQQGAGGGGDCGLATSFKPNAAKQFTYAYSGLGPLTGFTTSSSQDTGRTIENAGPQGNGNTAKGGGADRQWMTFLDDPETVLLSYNQQQPRNIVVQKSTDGGKTYNGVDPANPQATADRQGVIAGHDPDFPGQMRSMPANLVTPGATGRVAYFGWNSSDADFAYTNFAISDNSGLSWRNCLVAKVPLAEVGDRFQAFTTADNDDEGNIYLSFADKNETSKAFHTYLTTLRASRLAACDQPTDAQPTKNPGWSAPVQVDRDPVRTTVFPWLVAEGKPGRVAVTFYGTETDGNPNQGDFKAAWDVYVAQSLNALDPTPAISQVKATTHPFHVDSICLNGLGCDVSGGDRSLVDFFAIDYDKVRDRLQIVFNRTGKKPGEPEGHVGLALVTTQIGGPTMSGGTTGEPERPVLRDASADPTGDALVRYSVLNPPGAPLQQPDPTNEPALDFTAQQVAERAEGGFAVRMRVANLSDAALQQALADTGGRSLLWVFRFVNGYQEAAASARWNPGDGFTFGFNGYSTGAQECGGAPDPTGPTPTGEKCLKFPGDQPIKGRVVQGDGTIELFVPRDKLRELAAPAGDDPRPKEVAASGSARFYDAAAFSMANVTSPTQDVQSFLYPGDNAPAMDFAFGQIPSAAAAGFVEPTSPAAETPTATPTACAASAGFRSAQVRPSGRRARFSFTRRAAGPVRVDVFQQSRGRQVIGERLVARFRDRARSFTWNGRANRPGRRVTDGYYVVRFSMPVAGGRQDVRRVALRRVGSRLRARPSYYRRGACDLFASYKLERPVFGGPRNRALGISYRLTRAARVTVTIRRGARVVKRFAARTSRAARTYRLRFDAEHLPRGDYRVTLSTASLRSTLISRRL